MTNNAIRPVPCLIVRDVVRPRAASATIPGRLDRARTAAAELAGMTALTPSHGEDAAVAFAAAMWASALMA